MYITTYKSGRVQMFNDTEKAAVQKKNAMKIYVGNKVLQGRRTKFVS